MFHSRPVHSLMLSSHRFLCLPLRLPPWTVPCRTVLASPDVRVTYTYHFSLCLFTVVKRSSYGPMAFPILAFTSWMTFTWTKNAEKSSYHDGECSGHREKWVKVCLLVGCLTSQQQASVSQGRICSDNHTCCHTEIEVADPTFYLTQSQHTDTGPTSPSADTITPGAWRVATGVPIFKSLVWLDPEKIPLQAGFEPGTFRSRGGRLNH